MVADDPVTQATKPLTDMVLNLLNTERVNTVKYLI